MCIMVIGYRSLLLIDHLGELARQYLTSVEVVCVHTVCSVCDSHVFVRIHMSELIEYQFTGLTVFLYYVITVHSHYH